MYEEALPYPINPFDKKAQEMDHHPFRKMLFQVLGDIGNVCFTLQ